MRPALLIVIAGGLWAQTTENDRVIVPGERVGPITRETTEQDLQRLFGASNVKDVVVYLGEGFEAPGTAVFEGDPDRMLQLLWTEGTPKRLTSIRICTEAADACQWHTASGITMHTDLTTLESVNGRPFPITGFGWDYGGGVPGWDGGELDAARGRLWVRLEADRTKVTRQEYNSVRGDRDFRSSHPVMRKMNPRVYQMYQDFKFVRRNRRN